MAKPKAPLLSLAAHGTVGDALTYSRLARNSVVRTKPRPTDRRTLLQQYQRWLFQDAGWYWRTLTNTQKAVYRAAGARLHMPAYANFLLYYLVRKPDFIAQWRLDEPTGTVAQDQSYNANHGTIFGALPSAAHINGGRVFDGLDDRIRVPHSASISITDDLTFMGFLNLIDKGDSDYPRLFDKSGMWNCYFLSNRKIVIGLGGVTGTDFYTDNPGFNWGVPFHLAITRQRSTGIIRYFIEGDEVAGESPGGTEAINTNALPLYIGNNPGLSRSFHGWKDHLEILNRVCTPAQIKQHSERRYP